MDQSQVVALCPHWHLLPLSSGSLLSISRSARLQTVTTTLDGPERALPGLEVDAILPAAALAASNAAAASAAAAADVARHEQQVDVASAPVARCVHVPETIILSCHMLLLLFPRLFTSVLLFSAGSGAKP